MPVPAFQLGESDPGCRLSFFRWSRRGHGTQLSASLLHFWELSSKMGGIYLITVIIKRIQYSILVRGPGFWQLASGIRSPTAWCMHALTTSLISLRMAAFWVGKLGIYTHPHRHIVHDHRCTHCEDDSEANSRRDSLSFSSISADLHCCSYFSHSAAIASCMFLSGTDHIEQEVPRNHVRCSPGILLIHYCTWKLIKRCIQLYV